ncbi:30S ribosomal protein S8 [Candidatus Poribacteria bacterium]|nr:30S ribosomal protein S8 [Candidatus Poribacteria bacterium]
MSMTDPVADMLTQIRNATMRRKESLTLPSSRIRQAIAHILVEEGFVRSATVVDGSQQMLKIDLKYGEKREQVIEGIRRISKPGRRVYADRRNLPRVRNGLGIAVISTSQGVLTERTCRERGIGGEVLCYIW